MRRWQKRTKVMAKWGTILSLWLGPLAHEVYEKGVGAREEQRLFCMVLWLSEKKSVFRKVTLLELLLWVQTVRGIQRLYILFIVCVCAYSPVWCLLEPEVSVDAMWSNYGESWDGKLTLTATTMGLWRPVGWLLGVCHSLVHWTLPLHRVIRFSWFFFLSLMTVFGFLKFSFNHNDFPC